MFKRLIATGLAVSLSMAAAPIMAQDAPAEEAAPARSGDCACCKPYEPRLFADEL